MNPADAFRLSWQQSFHRFVDIISLDVLGGGSISAVYKIETAEGCFVMKIHASSRCPGMFKAEAAGLQMIMDTHSMAVPAVVAVTELKQHQVLILEYVEPGTRNKNFFSNLGQSLASMHRHQAEKFGLAFNNYMGSLPQDNKQEETLSAFYIRRRLEPQVRLALRQGKITTADQKVFDKFFEISAQLIPDEKPSFIHGDLWKGNIITGKDGNAWLIDPAVSFSCREADIAMTTLFGGFDPGFYRSYCESYPLCKGWEERCALWNLYPLLVHVNLFGGSYLQQTRAILKHYTG